MSVRKIYLYPDPVLREVNEDVVVFDDALKELLDDMWETMYASDGIGLAAPQNKKKKKIVVIDLDGEKYTLINPQIIEKSGEVTHEEGCLSFPGTYVKVDSPETMTVKYQNELGEECVMHTEDFLTTVFSHEIDHLSGRLLIDRVSPLKRQFMKKRIAKAAKEEQ